MEDSRSIIGAMYWKTNSLQTQLIWSRLAVGWKFSLIFGKEKIEQGHLDSIRFLKIRKIICLYLLSPFGF